MHVLYALITKFWRHVKAYALNESHTAGSFELVETTYVGLLTFWLNKLAIF